MREPEKFKEIFSKNEYQLPIRWDGKDFYATLYKHLKNYREDIDNFYRDDTELCEEVKTVCLGICAAVDCSFRGYPAEAYKRFEGVMGVLSKNPLLIDEKDVNKELLYRVVDVENAAVPNRQRIFHVPFSMRSKMSTQRYSIPGFPSLYLGTSVELCCMEMNKDPQRDYICVSRFELQTDERINIFFDSEQSPIFDNDEFKIFDVSIKPDTAIKKTGHDDGKIKYIKWYPLISACSYIRAMRDTPYSAEYIIPQLFLQWARSEYEEAVVGIKYFSCVSWLASTLGYNYVFPSTGTPYHARKTITDYCARLSHRFKLTAPKLIKEYDSIWSCRYEIEKDLNLDYIEDIKDTNDEEIIGEYEIREGVSVIGAFAFSGCSKLTNIIIPDSVTSIGDYAFSGCSNLEKITIPGSVTSIGDCAFSGCSALKEIIIQNSVTSIGGGAFYECSALKEIIIPDSIPNIGEHTFSLCSSLKSISIPNSVTNIGEYAFEACDSLTNIIITDSVTSIGYAAFLFCSSLKSINIPNSVTRLEEDTFSCCESLTSITIPDSVTSIGDHAFFECRALKEIIIPDSVTSIGDFAFSGCIELKTVYYSGTEEQRKIISIGRGNDELEKADWVYGFSGKES